MTARTMPLDCDEFAGKLADYLEGELPDAVRVTMEAHASSCAECGRLLSEIESLRTDAAALPSLEPSRDLWAGIAERIDARVLPLDTTGTPRVAAVRRTWRHPAVAAAALVLLTAGVTHVWTRASFDSPAAAPSGSQRLAVVPPVVEPSVETEGTTPSTREATSSAQPPVGRRASELATSRPTDTRVAAPPAARLVSRRVTPGRLMKTEVEPVFDREIVKLRAIVRDRRAQLDPRTVAVLEQSIAVIDSAIAQSRAALARDPASGFLATRLNHSLEKKVELLRTAALLPART